MSAVMIEPQTEAQILTEFYSTILPTQGRYVVFTMPDKQHRFVDSIAAMVSTTLELEKVSTGAVYHANASYGATDTRTQSNVVAVKSFWMDIDCGDSKAAGGKGYATKKDATSALKHFLTTYMLPAPTYLIDSGNGLHLYWTMTEDITPDVWKSTATKLDSLCKHAGLLVDPSRTKDSASILRPPGTMNRKDTTNPKPVKVKLAGELVSFEVFNSAIKNALAGVSIGLPNLNAPQAAVASQNDDLITHASSSPSEPYPYEANRENFHAALYAAYPNPDGREGWLIGLSALAYLVVAQGWDEVEVTKLKVAWESTSSTKLSASDLLTNESQWQDLLTRTRDKHARGEAGLVTHLSILKRARDNGWQPVARELDALSAAG